MMITMMPLRSPDTDDHVAPAPAVTRFAPSPSGHLHVGGARTALFCWAYARKQAGGKFILRIEDTDQRRSSDAASAGFLEDLLWLGLQWDEGPEYQGVGGGPHGPYHQSERLDIYQAQLQRLIEIGRAYPAFETPEALDAQRAEARARKQNYRYDRASLELPPAVVAKYLAEGRPHVIRFRVPDDQPITISDRILGEVTLAPDSLDDFVIQKADGFPTYHFAVVVDDELMGVTHVLRAQEHFNNTAKHMLLQDALGFRRPVYGHLPIIQNPDGSKMSKRDKDKTLRQAVKQRNIATPPQGTIDQATFDAWLADKDRQLDLSDATRLAAALGVTLPEIDVDDFRRSGYLPSVLINFLALNGWNPGQDVEKFDADFLIERFSLERVQKTPARFDRDKLLAFNLDALQSMPGEAFVARYRAHAEAYRPEFIARLTAAQFDQLARANQPRAKTLDDTFESSRFFIADDEAIAYEDSKNVRKAMRKGRELLEMVRPVLAGLDDFTAARLEQTVKAFADEHAEGNLGKVAQPLRIAVSGGTISPGIFETLEILGQDAVLRRIDRCLTLNVGVETAEA